MPKAKITLASLYALIQAIKDSQASLEHSLQGQLNAIRGETNAFRAESTAFRAETNAFRTETNARFDSIERLQRKMAARLISIDHRLDDQGVMLASLQARVDTLYGLTEGVAGHTSRLEQEYVMITEGLRRLEKRFDVFEAQRLDQRITELEARVSTLESA